MTLPFKLPRVLDSSPPVWEPGKGFKVGDTYTSVLQYSQNLSAWNEKLTHFHELNAGENHFIDLASRQHTFQQIETYLKQSFLEKPVILEIGCSCGHFLQELQKKLTQPAFILGADGVIEPLKALAERNKDLLLFQFDWMQCPLPDNTIDVVVALNVLEHVKEDKQALQQAYRILKPGGIFIIEVPAGPTLYDNYDAMLMHYRRYRLKDLKKQLSQMGFNLLKSSHLGCFLYPGFWLVKKRNRWFPPKSMEAKQNSVKKQIQKTGQSGWLQTVMQLELYWGKRINYPWGIRCLLTCQK